MTIDLRDRLVTRDPCVAGRRGRGERGAGMVAGLAIIFAFTFGGLVWLARDVDRGLSNQSAAQSIAFQAARAGAQAAQVDALREGDVTVFDEAAARAAASALAERLFTSYGVDGTVIDVDPDNGKVTVIVEIVDGSKVVRGEGTVRAERTS